MELATSRCPKLLAGLDRQAVIETSKSGLSDKALQAGTVHPSTNKPCMSGVVAFEILILVVVPTGCGGRAYTSFKGLELSGLCV